MDDAAKRAYLAAFIDGEGHVGVHLLRSGYHTRTVAFSNADKQLLDRVVALAADVGLNFRVHFSPRHKPKWSNVWVATLAGGREAMERFRNTIPLQANRKRAALEAILGSYIPADEISEQRIKRRRRVDRVCEACGVHFWTWPSIVVRGEGRYCSTRCGASPRETPLHPLSCHHCGETFFVKAGRLKSAKFCSHTCQGKAQSVRIAGLARRAAAARWGTVR